MIHTIYIENVNIMNTARPQLFACAELVPGYANGYMYIYSSAMTSFFDVFVDIIVFDIDTLINLSF